MEGPCVKERSFDTVQVEPDFQVEAWRESGGMLWDLMPRDHKNTSFTGWRTSWQSPRMVLMDVHHKDQIIGRPCSRRRSGESENIGITFLSSGMGWSVNSGNLTHENPGDILISQSNASEVFSKSNVRQRYVGFSYSMIGFDPSQHLSLLHLQNGCVANRLMQTAAHMLFDLLPNAAPEEVELLEGSFCALVRSIALDERLSDESVASIKESRKHAMRKYVDDHLTDPAFGLETLQQAFHVSSATVKRDFADAGGLSRYIWRRRLERALLELTNADAPGRGFIAALSERWGFSDDSSFRHAFRREFSLTPGEAMRLTTEIPS